MHTPKLLCLLHLFYFFFLISCDAPLSLSISEAKRRTLIDIGTLQDTSQIGLTQVMEDSLNHWLATYNKAQTVPSVYLFRVENASEHSHAFKMPYKQDAKISKVVFQDVTYDGSLEMLVYLHYDYDLSYQGREVVIYKDPFDSTKQKDIFSFPLEQSWKHIESFDSIYGIPKNRKRIENHVTIEFFEGKILIKGTIKSKKHHILEYEWDDFGEAFRKILDEDLHEEEDISKGVVGKVKGSKILLEVAAHDRGCRAFVLEQKNGQLLPISDHLHHALRCSPVTSLSDNGRHLIYVDKKKDALKLYDFELDTTLIILDRLEAMEGISDIIWYRGSGRYDFAFVGVNMDEYKANTRIYIWRLQKNKWEKYSYDRTVFFECNFDGVCKPEQTYDYRFSKAGNFLYRKENKGQSKEDFSVIKLK